MEKILVVIDMQNFFILGPMGTPEAKAVVPRIAEKLKHFEGTVYVTQDVNPHCAEGTEAFAIYPPIQSALPANAKYFSKWTFGSVDLAGAITARYQELAADSAEGDPVLDVEFCGVCTNVCVISNTLMLKAFIPKASIAVDASCCAAYPPDLHQAALDVMQSCRIEIR